MTLADRIIERGSAVIRQRHAVPITFTSHGKRYVATSILRDGPVARVIGERADGDGSFMTEVFIDAAWAAMTTRAIKRGHDLSGLVIPDIVMNLFAGAPRSTYCERVADAVRLADRAGATYRELVCETRLVIAQRSATRDITPLEAAMPCHRSNAIYRAARNLRGGRTVTGDIRIHGVPR